MALESLLPSFAQQLLNQLLEQPPDAEIDRPSHATVTIVLGLLHAEDVGTAADAARVVAQLTSRDRAGSGPEYARDDFLEAGAVERLVALVRLGADCEAARAAAGALGNLGNVHGRLLRAGGIVPLVAMLSEGASSQTAIDAFRALFTAAKFTSCGNAIYEAGAVAPLVTMLRADSHAEKAAELLRYLMACDNPDVKDAIRVADGLTPLVAMLRDAGSVEAKSAAATLRMATVGNPANRDAVREADGIPPLVALLAHGDERDDAATTLSILTVDNLTNGAAVLTAVTAAGVSPWASGRLTMGWGFGTGDRSGPVRRTSCFFHRLQFVAKQLLDAAMGADDAAALQRTIEEAAAVQVDAAVLARAKARLEVLQQLRRQKARRETLGLGALQIPADFTCPITYEVMADPVLASDGHTYERTAIQSVLATGNGRSPLTREALRADVLVPNRALKRRIEEHEEEVLQAAEMAVAAAEAARAPTHAAQGASSGTRRSKRARAA